MAQGRYILFQGFMMQSAADDTKWALYHPAEPGPTDMPACGLWGIGPSWGSGWLAC